jgi:hypothetical protein
MWFATPAGRGKRDMKYVGKLEMVLLIRVTGNPATLRQIHSFPAKQSTLYLFNDTIPNRLGLIGSLQRKTKILKGKEETPL